MLFYNQICTRLHLRYYDYCEFLLNIFIKKAVPCARTRPSVFFISFCLRRLHTFSVIFLCISRSVRRGLEDARCFVFLRHGPDSGVNKLSRSYARDYTKTCSESIPRKNMNCKTLRRNTAFTDTLTTYLSCAL